MSGGSSFSLGVSGIESPHAPHYSLGVPGLEQPPAPAFSLGVPSLSSAPLYEETEDRKTFSDFIRGGAAKPEHSILDLTLDTVALIPGLERIRTAMDLGQGLHDVVQGVEESDTSKTQAALCKTAKVGTELLVQEFGSRVIVGGVPLLLATSIADPPFGLVAVPVAAVALPQAYANMQHLAEFAGEKAEEKCEELFSGKQ